MRAFLWKLVKRAVIAFVLLVAVVSVTGVVLWLLGGRNLAARVTRYVNAGLLDSDRTRLEIGEITGNPFGNLAAERVRLLVRDERGEFVEFARIRRVRISYSPLGVFRGEYLFPTARVERPDVQVREQRDGWLLPDFGGEESDGPAGSKTVLRFTKIRLVEGRVSFLAADGDTSRILDLSADVRLDVDGDIITVDLANGRFAYDRAGIEVETFSGKLVSGNDALRFSDVVLGSGDSELRGGGLLRTERPETLAFDARLAKVRLRDIRGLVRQDALPDSGEVSGTLSLDGTVDSLGFRWSLGGEYGALSVERTEGRGLWRADVLRLSDVAIRTPRSAIERSSLVLRAGKRDDYETRIVARTLDLQDLVDLGVKTEPGILSGAASGRGRGLISGKISVAADLDLGPGKALGLDWDAARGRVAVSPDGTLRADSLRVSLGGSTVRIDAGWDAAKRLEGRIGFALASLEPVAARTEFRDLAGRATGDILLGGTVDAPEGEFRARGAGISTRGVSADSVTSAEGTFRLGTTPAVAARVHARGIRSGKTRLGNLETTVAYRDSLVLRPFRIGFADTSLEAAAIIQFTRDELDVRVDGLRLRVADDVWTSAAPIRFRAGERVTFDPLTLSSRHGDVRFAGWFRPDGKALDATLQIENLALGSALRNPFLGRPLTGTLDGAASVTGSFENPEIAGGLRAERLRLGDAVLDSLDLVAAVTGNRVTIETAHVLAAGGRIDLSGSMDLARPLGDWSKVPVDSLVAPAGLRFDLAATVREVDLSRIQEFDARADSLWGSLDLRAAFAGTLAEPQFRIAGSVDSLEYETYSLDRIETEASYRNGTITFSPLLVADGEGSARAEGNLPIRLNLLQARAGLEKDRPIAVSLDIPKADIRIFAPLLRTLVEDPRGTLAGGVIVEGTPGDPLLSGALALRGVSFHPRDREELAHDFSGDLTMDGRVIHLKNCAGKVGEEGTVEANGSYSITQSIDSGYRVEVRCRNVVGFESGLYAALFDGDFQVVPARNRRGKWVPSVTGRARVRRMEILMDFVPPEAPASVEEDFFFQVEVEAPARIYVVNTDMDIELGAPDLLIVRGSLRTFALTGDLEVVGRNGEYYFLLSDFTVRSGTLSFRTFETIDPAIDFVADTRVGEVTVTLEMRGTISKPTFAFSTDDPRITSEDDILRLLAAGSVGLARLQAQPGASGGSDRTGSLGGDIASPVASRLFRDFERQIRNKIGVDKFDAYFRPSEDRVGRYEPVVGVSKFLTQDISVNYSQSLSQSLNQDLSLEYRLRRFLFVRSGVVRRRDAQGAASDVYNLDFRFRHEY